MKGSFVSRSAELFLLIMQIGSLAQAQHQTGSLQGLVLDKASNQPLPWMNVLIGGTSLGTTTDVEGRYMIRNIPVGPVTVKFSMVGYKERLVTDVNIQSGRNTLDAFLDEITIEAQEVVVTPKPERYDASGISARLGKDMVAGTPGSAQDVFWVIQTLPGIASGDNSKLYVRGGSPDENLVLYDGATIGNPFHFDMTGGGFWSIFNSRLVEKVEFYAGGFPARYGDRLSSVLLIENRTASFDKVQGEASLSMSDVSGLIEAPLPFANGAALVSARRSYFEAILKLTDFNEDYGVIPYFIDMNAKADFNLSEAFKLSISGLYSKDRMYGYFDRSYYGTGEYNWESGNGVVSARLRSVFKKSVLSDLILSWGRINRSLAQPSNGREKVKDEEFSVKQDILFIMPSHELHMGGWLVGKGEDVLFDVPSEIALNFNEMRLQEKGRSWKPSLYVDDKWTISPAVTANLGVRYDYTSNSKQSTLSPRLNLAYAWSDHMSISFDYGWYYQSPKAYELAINSTLLSKKAESYGIGMKHQVGDEIVVSLELYNKNLTRLITIDPLWNLSNNGYGYSRGAEFYFQLKSASGFFGWLSYTYSVSKRKEGTTTSLRPFEFDRPHLMSLVANYSFGSDWQVGVRYRYARGSPYTPVLSATYDNAAGRWYPVLGESNSDRYPAYNRLDVRVTRRFKFEAVKLDVYVELLNVFNQRNIIHYEWSEDYSSRGSMTVFSFIPVIGVSAQF